MKCKINKKKGFTAVELLAIIAILAILVLIAAPQFSHNVRNAEDVTLKADLKQAEENVVNYLMREDNLDKKISKGKEKGFNRYEFKGDSVELIDKNGDSYIYNPTKVYYNVTSIIDSQHSEEGVFVYDGERVLFGYKGDSTEIAQKPEIPVTKESDFTWIETDESGSYLFPNKAKKGYWKYTGKSKYVNIPETIEGSPLNNYFKMFEETEVERVVSKNKNVTGMGSMFRNLKSNVLDLEDFVTDKVTNMSFMFRGNNVENLDLSSFNTENVTNMNYMFSEANSKSVNLESFDTRKVRVMTGTFNLSKMEEINIENFSGESLVSTNFMFAGTSAKSINLENLKPNNITNTNSMFLNTKAEEVNFKNFNTEKVNDMGSMFRNSKIKKIDIRNLVIKKDAEINRMLENVSAKEVIVRSQDEFNLLNRSASNKPGDTKLIVKQ